MSQSDKESIADRLKALLRTARRNNWLTTPEYAVIQEAMLALSARPSTEAIISLTAETPRTDAWEKAWSSGLGGYKPDGWARARELERELRAALSARSASAEPKPIREALEEFVRLYQEGGLQANDGGELVSAYTSAEHALKIGYFASVDGTTKP